MSLEFEYQAARNGAGVIDLSARGKIEVTGPDRVSFLHNILSQDIKTIPTGGCRPAALLSAPAKVLALMNVWKLEDKILLDTDSGFEEKLLGLLEKFIITEEVALRKATQEYAHFQIKGPKAETVLPQRGEGILQESLKLKFNKCHYEIVFIAPPADGNTLRQSLIKAGAVPIGIETAEVLRIEEGVLRYGVDITEEVSLPETGLDETYASETKGCYPGQEVVARTKTYKGLQRKMTGLVILSPLASVILNGAKDLTSGNKIYAGEKEIGWITSACISPSSGGIALGYLAKGFFPAEGEEKQTQVEIKTASGNIPAKTKSLPFVNITGTDSAKRTCP